MKIKEKLVFESFFVDYRTLGLATNYETNRLYHFFSKVDHPILLSYCEEENIANYEK
jgi:hypothetical protein